MSIERLQSYYSFTRMPFGRGLAPAMLHRHPGHAEAVARITWCVDQHAIGVITREVGAGKTTNAAWRSKPSFYAVSTEDRTINPDLERFMAKRMGAKTIEVKASHLALISHPDEISRLILEAAGQV